MIDTKKLHDELLLPVEIATLLERPPSSVYVLIKERTFPEPVFNKLGFRMWHKSDVLKWQREHGNDRRRDRA
jgi:predicted DNA-binding transcriptional regulator AlpA